MILWLNPWKRRLPSDVTFVSDIGFVAPMSKCYLRACSYLKSSNTNTNTWKQVLSIITPACVLSKYCTLKLKRFVKEGFEKIWYFSYLTCQESRWLLWDLKLILDPQNLSLDNLFCSCSIGGDIAILRVSYNGG